MQKYSFQELSIVVIKPILFEKQEAQLLSVEMVSAEMGNFFGL